MRKCSVVQLSQDRTDLSTFCWTRRRSNADPVGLSRNGGEAKLLEATPREQYGRFLNSGRGRNARPVRRKV